MDKRMVMKTVFATGDPATEGKFFVQMEDLREVTDAMVVPGGGISGQGIFYATSGGPNPNVPMMISGDFACSGVAFPRVQGLCSGNIVEVGLYYAVSGGLTASQDLSGMLFTVLAQGY